MLGLYLHIPFCQAICSYCNFNRGLLDAALKRAYVSALQREIQAAGDGRDVDTIFFGGGTPSLLEPDEVGAIIQACRDAFRVTATAEITLETNPETATLERLTGVREAGVNRLSIGVQSFDDGELARLGRVHSSARAVDATRTARRAGFSNLSLDVMLWLPGQTRDSWHRTVGQAIALEPDHLSLYLLELYPAAPLKEAMARAVPQAGDAVAAPMDWVQAADDEAADMYLEAFGRLDGAGFVQYEISNTAKPGFPSRHNLKYWQAGDWWGFGCGAHSTVDGRRWRNLAATGTYVERVNADQPVTLDERRLSADERIEEALFTGLRLTEGIDRGNFQSRYGVDPWSRYGRALAEHVEADLVWTHGDRFGLTRRGMLLANEVLALFV
jgi:oxygen-independent coproporphyrinogen III oxidase